MGLRNKIDSVEESNHEVNEKAETVISDLESDRNSYVANHGAGNTQIEDRIEQLKHQINHDEKYRERYEHRAVKNQEKADNASNKVDRKRFLKLAAFDKKIEAHFLDADNSTFDKLKDYEKDKDQDEERFDNTIQNMTQHITRAEVTAFKERVKGAEKVAPLKEKKEKLKGTLAVAENLNHAGINEHNLEKVKKIAKHVVDAANKAAKEASK